MNFLFFGFFAIWFTIEWEKFNCSSKDGETITYNVICYYKTSDSKFTRISGSILSNGESYLSVGGMGMPVSDISFDEISKKVKSGVYKESSSLKLREVEYVLP